MTTSAPAESLTDRAARLMADTFMDALPGHADFLARESRASQWIDEQEAKIRTAIAGDDLALLDRALGTWVKAINRVNEILAEEYRQAHPDPATWELRYIRWMSKLTYIRFDSPLGEFYLLPQKPSRRPKVERWYTVDEMIAMLHPAVAATINIFGVMPPRPDALLPRAAGDHILHLDATGPQVVTTYEREDDHGRTRLR